MPVDYRGQQRSSVPDYEHNTNAQAARVKSRVLPCAGPPSALAATQGSAPAFAMPRCRMLHHASLAPQDCSGLPQLDLCCLLRLQLHEHNCPPLCFSKCTTQQMIYCNRCLATVCTKHNCAGFKVCSGIVQRVMHWAEGVAGYCLSLPCRLRETRLARPEQHLAMPEPSPPQFCRPPGIAEAACCVAA